MFMLDIIFELGYAITLISVLFAIMFLDIKIFIRILLSILLASICCLIGYFISGIDGVILGSITLLVWFLSIQTLCDRS
jgi:hypothetical protein